MKAINHLLMFIFCSAIFICCDKNEINPTIDEFCSVAPDGWECEIIQDNFDTSNIPQDADMPDVIIKFINLDREFAYFVGNTQINPSLILNFYSIKTKKRIN